MLMREGESIKAYSDRYWEMFNEIDGDFNDVAIKTFKVDLPFEHDLRESLTGKPVTSLRQLMDGIDKYKKIEDDQQQGKGKAKVIPQKRRVSGRTATTITNPGETLLGNRGLPLLKCLTQCSENQYTKSWRKLRTSHSLGGQIRWEVTS